LGDVPAVQVRAGFGAAFCVVCGNAFGHNDHFGGVNSNFTEVPEPSTWALMASGLCTLVAAVRRRRR
jgi:hypothetical protein